MRLQKINKVNRRAKIRMRMIAVFEKQGAAKYVAHLDLLRAMQRAIRRAKIPVKYSSGFNPHQLLAFSSAMSVGMASFGEMMDVTLLQNMDEQVFLETLAPHMPPGITLREAHSVTDRFPALMKLTAYAEYTVTFTITRCLTQEEMSQKFISAIEKPLIAWKKGKSGGKEVDLRQWIEWIKVHSVHCNDGETEIVLFARLVHAPSGALNPQLLMDALFDLWGMESACSICRTAMLGQSHGQAVPLWKAWKENDFS